MTNPRTAAAPRVSWSRDHATLVPAARSGPVETADRGPRLYYAAVDTMRLDNVDTCEGIWSAPADGLERDADGRLLFDLADDASVLANDIVPLTAIDDALRWSRLEARFRIEKSAPWEAFVRRVANPLRRA